jgi:hypothetical protein
MYADTPLRKPTFDVSKAIKPIGTFFVRIYNAFIEARRLQAAMQTAQHLKATNRDYRSMSLGDIVAQIMEEK